MLDDATRNKLAEELYEAATGGAPVPLISARYPEAQIEDAYRVSLGLVDHRRRAGETVIGKKIGLTAKAVQDMLGIDEPDYGFLTTSMQVQNGAELALDHRLRGAMVEAEIALVMKSALPTEGVTPEMVLEAADYAVPSLELVATRFDSPKIKIVDTVADNASCALFLLGETRVDPRELDLAAVTCTVRRNGEEVATGKGEAVMGSPLNSTAWLANKLGEFGVRIEAGDIVLPGSVAPLLPIASGDRFEAEFAGLGRVACSFR